MWQRTDLCLLFLTLIFIAQKTHCEAEKKKILSFGGNGNIGSEFLTRLIEKGDYDITLVSRGKWHFDSAVRVQPYVKNVICDRSKEAECAAEKECEINTLKNCTELMKVINETETFHAVVDFSAYEPKWVHDAIHVLKGKTRVFVYVSTDSVYEVCEPKAQKRPSRETDDVRPTDLKKRKELKAADRYGDAKLAGEEALRSQREDEDGFPFVALRFADVIGPRDTTERWFMYQLWVKLYKAIEIPIFVPPTVVDLTQSMTYVNDAAESIILAMEKGPEVWDEAYNIGFDEETTLWETVQRMGKVMGVEGMEQDTSHHDKQFHLYPSVFAGPMDISKAKEKLGFKPSSIDEAFKATIEWYDKYFLDNEAFREEMLKRFITYVIPREKKDVLYLAVAEELEKHGIVNEVYRKKKKGDLGLEGHEEL